MWTPETSQGLLIVVSPVQRLFSPAIQPCRWAPLGHQDRSGRWRRPFRPRSLESGLRMGRPGLRWATSTSHPLCPARRRLIGPIPGLTPMAISIRRLRFSVSLTHGNISTDLDHRPPFAGASSSMLACLAFSWRSVLASIRWPWWGTPSTTSEMSPGSCSVGAPSSSALAPPTVVTPTATDAAPSWPHC